MKGDETGAAAEKAKDTRRRGDVREVASGMRRKETREGTANRSRVKASVDLMLR